MERIVYCQDGVYLQGLNHLKGEKADKVGNGQEFQLVFNLRQEPSLVKDMVCHTTAYFNVSLQPTVQHFHCILNAVAPTPHPHLAVVMPYYAWSSSQRV